MEKDYKLVTLGEHSRAAFRKRYLAAIGAVAVAGIATLMSVDSPSCEDTDMLSDADMQTAVTAVTGTCVPVADREYIPETVSWTLTALSEKADTYSVSEYTYLASENAEDEYSEDIAASAEETIAAEADTDEAEKAEAEEETVTLTEAVTEAEAEPEAVTEAQTQAEEDTQTQTDAEPEYEPIEIEVEIGDEIMNGIAAAEIEAVSRFDAPDWLYINENGVPTEYKKSIHGISCAYTAAPDALMSTGKTVFQGYVAVDPDIIPYGSELYIAADDGSVYGYAIAADTGYSVSVGDIVVDLFMDDYDECIEWGAKEVTIYVLN